MYIGRNETFAAARLYDFEWAEARRHLNQFNKLKIKKGEYIPKEI